MMICRSSQRYNCIRYEDLSEMVYSLRIVYDKSFKLNFYREWQIWSKCFGKVFVINGVSSAGKSTASSYLSNIGFNYVGMDSTRDKLLLDYINKYFEISLHKIKEYLSERQILKIISGSKITTNHYSIKVVELVRSFQKEFFNHITQKKAFLSVIEIFEEMYSIAKNYIFSGQNVVLDIVANENELEMLHYSFRYYPLKIGILYSSLEYNLKKCFQRNYLSLKNNLIDFRFPSDILEQYMEFYKFIPQNVHQSYKHVFGKMIKTEIEGVLEASIYCQNALIKKFETFLIDQELYELLNIRSFYEQKIAKLHHFIELIKESFLSEQITYIVPKIDYDFIMFFSNVGGITELKTILLENDLGCKANQLMQMSYENKVYLHENLLLGVKELTTRFIVYTSNKLPEIFGHFGEFIELEYNEASRALGEVSFETQL